MCGYASASKDRLISHVRIKHKPDEKDLLKKFKCVYCDFTTVHQSSLVVHEYAKHLHELPPEKVIKLFVKNHNKLNF